MHRRTLVLAFSERFSMSYCNEVVIKEEPPSVVTFTSRCSIVDFSPFFSLSLSLSIYLSLVYFHFRDEAEFNLPLHDLERGYFGSRGGMRA